MINRKSNRLGPSPASHSGSLLLIQLLLILPSLLVHQLAKCSQLVESGSSRQEILLRTPKMMEPHHYFVDDKLAARQNRTTSVSDLRLTADFRAAKLRWIYRLDPLIGGQVEPASFDVRFCEITTWNAEIKCRHREMLVATMNTSTLDKSVITTTTTKQASRTQQQELTVLGRQSSGIEYEAQIFDLRALTNYTFQVSVLRFSDEPPLANGSAHLANLDDQQRRLSKAARRLSIEQQLPTSNELTGRLETKPFRAEATKCLADVSEVVITTGKYFGGRITVEGSLDRRCQLTGNKSSEQSSYTFKIEHEICHSKVVNGNRIETMILVHENKDILTHSTARFLVLCNFLQKSFTLRASISLPKVNGFTGNRQAVITSLGARPIKEQSVLLGNSMPGIFRAKPTDDPILSNETRQEAFNFNQSSNELDRDIPSAMEKKLAIEPIGDLRHRQPKGLNYHRKPQARFLQLLQADSSSSAVPEPVQIQSKLLYVERHQPVADMVMAKISPTASGTNGNRSAAAPAPAAATASQLQVREGSALAGAEEDEGASIILTNNHRVVGDFKPTSSLKLAAPNSSQSSSDGGLSIKYSGANISEYSVGQLDRDSAQNVSVDHENLSLQAAQRPAAKRGERTGRMQTIIDDSSRRDISLATATISDGDGGDDDGSARSRVTERRMGDMMIENGADLLAETSNNDDSQTTTPPYNQSSWRTDGGDIDLQHAEPPPNLAHNLTNYLLKWSLKTLTNLAKKSLQSLANRSDTTEWHEPTEFRAAHDKVEPDATPRATPAPSSNTSTVRRTTIQMTSIRPFASSSTRPAEIITSDGFHTHSRPQQRVQQPSISPTPTHAPTTVSATIGAQPAVKHASHQQQQQQHNHRASNYSKSLDLETTARARQSQTAPGRANPVVEQPRDSLAARQSNESGNHQHMRHADSSSISWLLVGCLLMLALIIGLLTIFCLVSAPPSPSFGGQSQHLAHAAHTKAVSSLPQLVFNGTIVANHHHQRAASSDGNHLDILPSSCYSEKYNYNRFENHASSSASSSSLSLREGDTLGSRKGSSGTSSSIDADSNNRLMLGNKQTKQSAHLRLPNASLKVAVIGNNPPPARNGNGNGEGNTSRRLASGLSSSSSSSVAAANDDENNCNNSELLLTEHQIVLMSTNSRAANESYA